MNKIFISLISISVALLMVACGGGNAPETVDAKPEAETAQATTASVTYNVDAASSSLAWIGRKQIGEDMHSGTIAIKDGIMSVEGSNLTAGDFTIDMASISVTDEIPEEYKTKLVGHLSADDFFNVGEYPTAKFAITKVTAPSTDTTATHDISGNLTIRDVTKEITIPAMVSMTEDQISAVSNFAINRADFNVKYGSSTHILDIAKDDIINDEIEFMLKLTANKTAPTGTK